MLDDADLDAAANGAASGIFAAAGQTCGAGSRLLVQRPVHDALVERIREVANRIKLGDPLLPETEMGPLASLGQFEKVQRYIEIAGDEGAVIEKGGGSSDLGGFFVRPTVLTNVQNSMRVAREEIFGPVLSVIPFDTDADAVALANDSPYGLAAGIWTSDIRRAVRLGRQLKVGTVWINDYRVSSYAVPSGGTKLSGYGRENGLEGLMEYVQTQATWIEIDGRSRDPFQLG